jgi:adenylate kinase
MNVLLIGPPGSGKGTQGQRLSERLGMRHIATGDILRKEVADKTPIGLEVSGYIARGELVPDQVIIDLVLPLVAAAANTDGYLLDGFPRSVDQADQVRKTVAAAGAHADAAIYLDAPRAALVQRLLERAEIEGRIDDTAEVIENRLQIFEDDTRPLVDYYRERGLLHIVDASRTPDEVTDQILVALDAFTSPSAN